MKDKDFERMMEAHKKEKTKIAYCGHKCSLLRGHECIICYEKSISKHKTTKIMKTTIEINGEKVEITLTPEQVAQIKRKTSDFRDIKTVEDAFEYLGINYSEWHEKYGELPSDVLAYMQLTHIAKAMNGGEWLDYDNTDVYKYYPYFHASGSALGFSYFVCDFGVSYSLIGSRLCFKSREMAEYAGKQFSTIYNQYIN